ncbi:hypothetical protein E6H34_05840 [Candidatus Bathyarchaeota archaeon]|nr:MAG: hypothetical protein E6H34_05840 [Candidatus Bathyarchaeota archaeon]
MGIARGITMRRAIYTTIMLVVAISIIQPAAAYIVTQGSQVTSNNTFPSLDPAVLYYHQNNTAWVFWSTPQLDGNYSIYYRIMPPNCLQNACLLIFFPQHRLPTENQTRSNEFSSATETSDGKVWVFFSSNRISNSTRQFWGVFYKTFNGTAWSGDTPLTSWKGTDVHPSAAVIHPSAGSPSNNVWVTWGSDHNCVCLSNIWLDKFNGTRWSAPQPVTSSGVDFGPSISQATNGTVWLTWNRNVASKGASDIYYERLGLTGTISQPVNLVSNSFDNSDPSILSVNGSAVIVVVWSSNINDESTPTYDLFMKYSLDGGATWNPGIGASPPGIQLNSDIPSPPDDDQPSVAQIGPGRIGIVWASNITGQTNIFSMTILIADIGVIAVNPGQTVIGNGTPLKLNVSLTNYGWEPENPTLKLFGILGTNSTLIQTMTTSVPYLGTKVISFTWNTTGWARGNYVLNVTSVALPGEANATNNMMTTNVCLTIRGDVTCDHQVNIFDLVGVSLAFGCRTGDHCYNSNMDLNQDGRIDILDLVYVATRFGTTG